MKPEEIIVEAQSEELETEVKNEEAPLEQTQIQDEVKSEAIKVEEVQTEEIKIIEIYTDGACSGNPGPGGYGAIILQNDEIAQISGGEKLTTNNKMELMGAIFALKSVQEIEARIKLYTDSLYVQKGITEWIENWKKKNFKDVKNVELWQELDALSSKLNIEWHWIKAHAGHKYNEMADALARSEVSKNR